MEMVKTTLFLASFPKKGGILTSLPEKKQEMGLTASNFL
jgi:hypothetical protein